MQRLRARARGPPRGPVADGHALVLVDVDDFKTVNDGLGHFAGDRMLVTLAERVASRVRSDDIGGPAGRRRVRAAGGEPGGVDDARRVADRLITALSTPVDIDGRAASRCA